MNDNRRKAPRAPFMAMVPLLAVLVSCASSPAAKVPQWVLSVPAADATTTWFTGSASIAGRDVAKANEAATADLVASIMRYVGARVTVQSSATARATLDSYQTDITQSVRTSADNRVAGFSINDRYVAYDPKTGRSTVYILAAYRTADLEAEKARIAAVFAEKTDAVSVPEGEGDALHAQGRDWEALGKYVQAAVAASGSDIDNADIKLQRNLDKAIASIASLRVAIVPPTGQANVGSAWPGPFVVRVVNGDSGSGVPGANLLISYPRKQGTRIGQRTVVATTGADGSASFMPPPPDFVGAGKFSAQVDFGPWSDQLDSLPQRWANSADALRTAFASAAADVTVSVKSGAASIPTAVDIVDVGSDGKPTADNSAGSALADALSRAGFTVNSLQIDPAVLAKADDAAVRQAATALGTSAARLVFGEAFLQSSSKDGDMWLAAVRIDARAIDLSSGRLLWSGELQATGVGVDEATADRAALRSAGGTALGGTLLSNLP